MSKKQIIILIGLIFIISGFSMLIVLTDLEYNYLVGGGLIGGGIGLMSALFSKKRKKNNHE